MPILCRLYSVPETQYLSGGWTCIPIGIAARVILIHSESPMRSWQKRLYLYPRRHMNSQFSQPQQDEPAQLPADANINRWMESMHERLAAQRQTLQAHAPETVAYRSGATWTASAPGEGQLSLRCLGMPVMISLPEYSVSTAQGAKVSIITEALIISYLESARGTTRAGEWVAFRDLPGGIFYHQAFSGYTGKRLTQHFGNNLDIFCYGAESAGGLLLPGLGHAAYEFQMFPHLWVAIVYWLGDPEDGLLPQANVLFDRAASDYIVLDGLAILGSQLVGHIIRASSR